MYRRRLGRWKKGSAYVSGLSRGLCKRQLSESLLFSTWQLAARPAPCTVPAQARGFSRMARSGPPRLFQATQTANALRLVDKAAPALALIEAHKFQRPEDILLD